MKINSRYTLTRIKYMLSYLPDEIISLLYTRYLDAKSILNLSQVNRHFYFLYTPNFLTSHIEKVVVYNLACYRLKGTKILHSRYEECDKSGYLVWSGCYHLGYREGRWTYYNPGSYQVPTLFTPYKNKRDYWSLWYSGSYIHLNYVKGKLQGKAIGYHYNGIKFLTCYYLNNQLEGMYKEYHTNGNLRMQCRYRRNNKVGLEQRYDEEGKLTQSITHDSDEHNCLLL